MRRAERIERAFREDFLPHFAGEIRLAEAVDFDRLSAAELVEEIGRLRERFVHRTHVEIDAINIAAAFYLDRARSALSTAGLDPSSILGHMPETAEAHAIAEALAAPAESRRWFLLRSIGHRATFDYELAEPRYAETPDLLAGLVDAKCAAPRLRNADDAGLDSRLMKLVEVARRFETLKEDAKHHSLRELAVLRRAVLALDRQLGLGGLIFHLSLDELGTMGRHDVASLRELSRRTKGSNTRWRSVSEIPGPSSSTTTS